jgi:FixJ family two-component response regulator
LTKVPVISIVDDDESVREATKGLIRSLGYKAVTFASAEEFLRSDGADDTACLIADVQMPGMSGIELQSRLLAQGRRLPIIFITSFPEAKARAQALAAGALGYLSKPFSDEKLITHLDQALAMRSC